VTTESASPGTTQEEEDSSAAGAATATALGFWADLGDGLFTETSTTVDVNSALLKKLISIY
jgi:hypothetical protein